MYKLLVLALFTFSAAQDIKEELKSFNKVKIEVSANTVIEFGDKFLIEIDGRERDLKTIRYSVNGKTLVIEDKRRGMFNWYDSDNHDRVKIRIVTKSLVAATFKGSGDAIIDPLKNEAFDLEISGSADVRMSGVAKDLTVDIRGSGDLTYNDLEANLLLIEIKGSGDVKADGMAKEAEIDIKGSGDVKASRLEVERLDASIYGSGDISITVNDEIRASIYGSGDIKYRGKARVVKERIYGSGDIERD